MTTRWTDADSAALDAAIKAARRPPKPKPILPAEDMRKIMGYAVNEPVLQAFNTQYAGRKRRGIVPSVPAARTKPPRLTSSGRWKVVLRVDGRRVQRTFDTQEEATQWRDEKEHGYGT